MILKRLSCLLYLMLMTQFYVAGAGELAGLLPDNVSGWTKGEADREYDPETLYDYIDGGAELYISYNFQQVVSRRYSREDQPDIVVELFDMGNAGGAYGVFSQQREEENVQLGQGGQYIRGSLMCWKDRYFLSIMVLRETKEAAEAMTKIGEAVMAAIPDTGKKPELIGLLPEKGMVENGMKYFTHYIWQNSFYYISGEDIFGLGAGVHAVLARYGKPGKRIILLLIEYPDPSQSAEIFRDLRQDYFHGMNVKGVIKREDGKYAALSIAGSYLVAAFNGTNKHDLTDLIQLTQQNIRNP